MIAAIYARTAQGSCEEQIAKCKQFIENSKWMLYKVYADENVSANSEREGLNLLINDARQGLFDTVVVNGIERLHRDAVKMHEFMEEMESCGVTVVFA